MNVDEVPEVMQAKMEDAGKVDNKVTAEVVASTPEVEGTDIQVDKAMNVSTVEVTKMVPTMDMMTSVPERRAMTRIPNVEPYCFLNRLLAYQPLNSKIRLFSQICSILTKF